MQAQPVNLLEIDSLVDTFLQKHAQGIATMHKIYFHNSDPLSVRALVAELVEELKTGCVTFFNKENPDLEELDSYLFYIANAFCKKKASPQVKKKTEYLCPGCLFLGKENLINIINKYFRCDECEATLRQATDPKMIAFLRVFFKHNKVGYRCDDCERFLPHPMDESPIITCPYLDCCFVGQWSSLRRMHHPTSESNAEILTLDAAREGGKTFKDSIAAEDVSALSQMEIQEDLENKIKLLRDIIDSQSNSIIYSSSDFTVKHKHLTYQAFNNLLKKYPTEMVAYLLNSSRSGGFQHKVFQEYIRLLEESLPFSFKKNGTFHKVETLLDDNLHLFDGISVFESFVTDNLSIKNGTKEFYIGGRKASVTKPYYIGKLLSVTEKNGKAPLTDKVVEYSFSKIKMRDILPGTEVIVTHLRVPPHYQMGGMVYVNRVRKKIVDRAISQLSKDSNEN
jgi:hypothetical protein